MTVPKLNIDTIDDVIHGRVRLGVMVYLADASVADFSELAQALATTNGNLSVHLRKLEDAGYVELDKSFLNRKPLTRVRITGPGRDAFARYLDAVDALLRPRGR